MSALDNAREAAELYWRIASPAGDPCPRKPDASTSTWRPAR